MNRGDSTQPGAPAVPGTAPDGKAGSGEGSDTALQALIRKRKQVEKPDHLLPTPPPAQQR